MTSFDAALPAAGDGGGVPVQTALLKALGDGMRDHPGVNHLSRRLPETPSARSRQVSQVTPGRRDQVRSGDMTQQDRGGHLNIVRPDEDRVRPDGVDCLMMKQETVLQEIDMLYA